MDFHVPRALSVLVCLIITVCFAIGTDHIHANPPETGDPMWRFAVCLLGTIVTGIATVCFAGCRDPK